MVIFNPTAGASGPRGRRLRRTLKRLRALGCRLELRETTRRGDAQAFAALASAEQVDVVVAAGGDGTINEVINGLISAPRRVPLGIIPLGTANVLAQDMGLGTTPEAIAQAIAHGPARPCALARVDGRAFLLMGGAGFDAHVVENVKLALKRHAGKLAYAWETILQARRYAFPTLRVVVDGTVHEAATVVVLNGRMYGGPFVAVPEASLQNPELHVVLLHRKGLWNVLRYAVALASGTLARLPDVTVLRTTGPIHIDGPKGAPFQADGDTFCALPASVELAGDGIELVYPA